MKKEGKKQEQNKNKFANYLKLILVFIAVIFLVLLLRNWYLNRQQYQLNIPIIKDTLIQEINTNEVYNYIRENENSVLYVGVVDDQKCRKFEEGFNEIIKDKNLQNTITYLNLTEENHIKTFLKEFNKFYGTKLNGYPAIIIFENGTVKDILIAESGKEITKEDATKFLDNNHIVSAGE